MSAETAIERLLEIHPKGFDLSLDRIRGLLEGLGNPQDRIPPVFHVAGTNGKGSVTAFLRAILEAAGKSVHVHTSPHLVHWHERYRIGAPGGGRLVADGVLEDAVNRAAAANGGRPITVFEIMSAVGFLLFSEHDADYTVLEVGLGGRFDATNVIRDPLVSVITPVALDHQAYLGDTIARIAFEKAGIIKHGRPVIAGEQEDPAFEVIEARAQEEAADLAAARRDFDWHERAGRFVYQDNSGLLDLPMPALKGDFQLANAATAIAAVRTVLPDTGGEVFERAMQRVRWPGRLERLPEGRLTALARDEFAKASSTAPPEICIDGGHNPQAGQMLSRELPRLPGPPGVVTCLIAGMLTTKDPSGYFAPLSAIAAHAVTVPVPDSEAGFDPAELARIATGAGIPAQGATSLEDAIRRVAAFCGAKPCRILVCGSLYLIGHVLAANETPPA